MAPAAQALPQFDVFLGFDGNIKELNWFPVVFEVLNDGPSFSGSIELSPSLYNSSQSRRIHAEFPTNTRKRFVMPVFASSRSMTWTARLLDDRGKVRAEQPNLRCKRDVGSKSYIMAAIPRSFGGMPSMPELKERPPELAPVTAHLRAELFPDNPITLEGLDALYLNSEKALELKAPQANALVRWVHQGGHLIVAIEQPADVTGTPWLRDLMPIELSSIANLSLGGEIPQWLRQSSTNTMPERTPKPKPGAPVKKRPNFQTPLPADAETGAKNGNPWADLPQDAGFEAPTTGIATGTLVDGKVVLAMNQTPLIVSANRDRGLITVILFNPEREPFRGWNLRPWLWARIGQVPPELLINQNPHNYYGGWSVDAVLGSMIDSKQVHKLPVSWLLLLLAVYLAVIGPIDRIVLKALNKQIWTWVTFPVYVVAFSLLIYFISYKLRSGESELNKIHFVDVYPNQSRAELRGRTYISIYSPANFQYPFASEQTFASIRGESQGPYSGGYEANRADIEQYGNNYRAQVSVPVWTSQLFVEDWWQSAPSPLGASLQRDKNKYLLSVTNLSANPLSEARLLLRNTVYTLGTIPPTQTMTFDLATLPFVAAQEFVAQNGGQQFQMAVNERRQAFQRESQKLEWNLALTSMAVSLLQVNNQIFNNDPNNHSTSFLAPSGLDQSVVEARGQALLMVWDASHSLTSPTHQFKPLRYRQDTLLRLAMPIPDQP